MHDKINTFTRMTIALRATKSKTNGCFKYFQTLQHVIPHQALHDMYSFLQGISLAITPIFYKRLTNKI